MLELRLRDHSRGGEADQFIALVSEHLAKASIRIKADSIGIRNHDTVRRALEEDAVARLTRTPCFLRADAFFFDLFARGVIGTDEIGAMGVGLLPEIVICSMLLRSLHRSKERR